ncbi:MAG: TAXI family TRAP transporter solute-binding subunit [Spirochaetes bacterium]|nr:TAXI family TRAP transporter solute-binding subunit [Spirochaetota bacterium]
MRKKSLKKVLVAASLLAMLSFFPVFTGYSQTVRNPYTIEIYGGKAGMTSYTAAIALAELINKNSLWLKATAIESISITANFMLLMNEPARRPDTLIVSMVSFHWLASRGKEPFTTRYDGLRFIATMGYHMQGFITLDPALKTVREFAGKRVSIGDRSSVSRVEIMKAVLRSAGVLDKVKLEYLSAPGGVNALRDGLIDATLGSATLVRPPGKYALPSYLTEITSTRDVYYVSMDKADIRFMNDLMGPLETAHTVPAGSLGETQTAPWTGLGKAMGWAADKDMPDEVVYEICRIIHENADEFAAYSPSLAFVNSDTMAKWDTARENIHTGALKFFAEHDIVLGRF